MDISDNGGWSFDGQLGWILAADNIERNAKEVKDALDEIEALQVNAQVCKLCGQRVVNLDQYGLCSKITADHVAQRYG